MDISKLCINKKNGNPTVETVSLPYDLIKATPNDAELGELVRGLMNEFIEKGIKDN